MIPTDWDECLETGHEEIDRQHRVIVDILRELADAHMAPDQKALEVLDRLMDFTISHFLLEEGLMAEVCYPAARTLEMTHSHGTFTDYARLRVLEFRMGNTASVLSLHGFVYDWLTVHEFGLDRQLANWIRDREFPCEDA